MSTRAKASGAVGSVIDGRFRDVQEQRDLGYPVSTVSPVEDGKGLELTVSRFLLETLELHPRPSCSRL